MKNRRINGTDHGNTCNPETKISDANANTMWHGNKVRSMKALRSEISKIDEIDSAEIRNRIDLAYADMDIDAAIKLETQLNDYLKQLHNAVDSIVDAEIQAGSSIRPRRKHPVWLMILRSCKLNENQNFREVLDKSTPEQVVWDMTKLIDYDPGMDSAYEERGIALSMIGNHGEALDDFTRAIELRPGAAGYFINRGIAYALDDNKELALRDFSTAINLDKDIPQAYYNRGALCCSLGMFIQALYDFSKAINIDPVNAEYFSKRGAVYTHLGETDLAIDDYTNAILLDDKCAITYANRGINYIDLGNYSSAIRDISRAIKLGLYSGDLYAKRAEAYQDLGKYAEAEQDILWSLELEGKGYSG